MKHLEKYLLLMKLKLNLSQQQTVALICGFALLLAILSQVALTEKSTEMQSRNEPESVDTYIPSGQVLVPIQVLNYESLDSILGSTGVVDLFVPSLNPQQSPKKVASRIKIIRAPNNASQFAVLAPDEIAENLVSTGSGYYVVVQNPKTQGTKIEKAKVVQIQTRGKSRIEVEVDDEKSN